MERSDLRNPRLEMRGIRKTFGPVKALRDVSLTAYGGEVHSLMGENGAGKSTLMKILSGAYVPDPGGEVFVDGKALPFGNPKLARAHGIAVIYQELALAPNLTVAQNVFLGEEFARAGVIDGAAMRRRTQAILERLGVPFGPDARVGSLSLGERQLVEIARALSTEARIIVMDEPTTSLSTRETEKLFEVIAALKRDGIAVIYISHRMDEVYALSDRCSVLRDGSYIGTLDRSELDAKTLVSMMVGRDLSTFYKKEHKAPPDSRDVVLSVERLSAECGVRDCSLVVHRGEVLGVAGLVGSGRTELLRAIYGAESRTSGRILLNGEDVTPASPREALDRGIVYLTEDRKTLGLFLDMSIRENVNIAVAEKDSGGLLCRNATLARKRAQGAMERLGIRAASSTQEVGALSGGNQQKVLLARLLETEPAVLLLDEPTRGVDIGAKSEIYRLIDQLAQQGLAIVLVSSELPEIIGVADRCVVMRDGKIVGEVTTTPDAPIEQEAIMTLSTGASAPAAAMQKPSQTSAEGVR